MKKTILVMVFSPTISTAFQFKSADLSDLHKHQVMFDAKVERALRYFKDVSHYSPLAADEGLERIFGIREDHVIGAVPPRMVKRSGSPPKQPSEADRQRNARRRVNVLKLPDMSRSSNVPSSASSNVQQSSEVDQAASKASGSSFASSKTQRFSQIQQRLTPPQDWNSKMVPEASGSLQRSRPPKIPKGRSRDPIVDRNTTNSPPSGRAITRSSIRASLGYARKVKDGASSSHALPRPRPDAKEPKQPEGPSEADSRHPSQPLQAFGSMDVIGTPSGLANIKVTGDTTRGLYERLERITSFSYPHLGAYFRHISMLGSPRAAVTWPPGIPKPQRVPKPPAKT